MNRHGVRGCPRRKGNKAMKKKNLKDNCPRSTIREVESGRKNSYIAKMRNGEIGGTLRKHKIEARGI